MDADKALLIQVFGESSASEDSENEEEEPQYEYRSHANPSWERFEQIQGLWLCRDFLSPEHQSSLLSAIQNGAFNSLPLFIHLLFIISHQFRSSSSSNYVKTNNNTNSYNNEK